MTTLSKIIAEEIASRGPITFARFMELALYCPEYGYYESERDRIGRKGDFYTSVSVGPLFGRLLGFRFASVLKPILVARKRVQLLETGGHDGSLARDILEYLHAEEPEVFSRVDYVLLEPSKRRQSWQAVTLRGLPVRWISDWSEIEEVGGVIFSNELLDAMPVHRYQWDAKSSRWCELKVGFSGGGFTWIKDPAGAPPPDHLAHQLTQVLPDGYTVEFSSAAAAYWAQAASRLAQGLLLTLDYGALHLLTPERHRGTLRAYRDHRVSGDVLAKPGEQDLTAHVDFGAMQRAGEAAGLRTQCFESQAAYLGRIFQEMYGRDPKNLPSPSVVRQFQSLTNPQYLGAAFSVLVQSRD